MKIKANNANSPIWKDVYSHSMLPEPLRPLYEMATNLWWVWNHEGAKLFGKIDAELWVSTQGNPVLLLQSLSYKRIEEIIHRFCSQTASQWYWKYLIPDVPFTLISGK